MAKIRVSHTVLARVVKQVLPYIAYWSKFKLIWLLWKVIWQYLWTQTSTTLTQQIYSQVFIVHLCSHMPIVKCVHKVFTTLFVLGRHQKRSKHLPVGKRLRLLLYPHYVVKKNESGLLTCNILKVHFHMNKVQCKTAHGIATICGEQGKRETNFLLCTFFFPSEFIQNPSRVCSYVPFKYALNIRVKKTKAFL